MIWWARHGLREAEERCCDAWVVWALPAGASLRHRTGRNGRFSLRGATRVAGGGERDRPCPYLEKEIDDDPARHDPAGTVRDGFPGSGVDGSPDAAFVADLGTGAAGAAEPPVPAEDKIRVLVEDFLLEDMTAFQMAELLLQLQAQKEAGQDTKEIDRVIAELKKKLAELEAKRAREKAKATVEDKKKAAEIEKARAEVNAAQERLHAAMERLAQLEGGKRRVIIAVERAAVPLKVEARTYELRKAAADALRNVQPQSNEERLKALEKNLADLLKEVQGLRKEMKKPGEPSGALDPKSPLSIRVRARIAAPAVPVP